MVDWFLVLHAVGRLVLVGGAAFLAIGAYIAWRER